MIDGGSRNVGPDGDGWVAAERGPFAGAAGHLDAPYRPTPAQAVDRMLDLARVGPADRLIDLGCGDGRIVIAAARRGASAFGIDIDPARVAGAERAAREAGLDGRTRFETGDLFARPLAGFTAVTLFLLPHVNRWLEGKLKQELARGARVIGHAFPMPGWPPAAQAKVGSATIYLWIRDDAPARPPVPHDPIRA